MLLDIGSLLLTATQLLLLAGPGAVLLINFAMKDIYVKDQVPTNFTTFASEYDELMWLVNKRERGLTSDERRRFYTLRNMWPKMDLVGQTISMASGPSIGSF